jgi:Tol biopolymer transport system component
MLRRWSIVQSLLLFVAGIAAVAGSPAPRAGADTLPSLTVGDVNVLEGDAGSAVVFVPVDLSTPSTTTVKVHYSITSTSASLGADYSTRTSGTVSFAAGATTKHLKILVFGDEEIESDESIAVTLSAPIGATLAKDSGLVTIIDDDADGADPGIEVNVGSVSVVEADSGRHIVSVPISLSRPATETIKVAFVGDCATALPGTDYSGKYTGTITFKAGQQSRLLTFTIVADTTPEDLVKQFVESLSVKFGPAVAINQIEGGGTIVDNDNGGSNAGSQAGLAVHEIKRVSVASDGSEGTSVDSYCSAGPYQWGALDERISGNGRYVVFVSDFPNLVPNDTNGDIDTFVHDLVTGETERVSVNSDGSEMTYPTHSVNPWQNAFAYPSISYDGRYVVFTDTARGLVYVRDRVAHVTEPISIAPDGSGPNDYPGRETGSISDDGRYVVFNSFATNLVSPPAAGTKVQHVYLRDRQTQTTQLITTLHDFNGGWAVYGGPKISGNGHYLAFYDTDSARVPGDTNGCPDAFVYDIANATYERVSVDSSGNQQTTGCDQYDDVAPVISSDGRYVGFDSSAHSLYGAGPADPVSMHSYLHDRVTGTTTLVDDPAVNPVDSAAHLYGISDDGRYATWTCDLCGDPPPAEPTSSDRGAFWTDLQTGQTDMIGMVGGDAPTQLDTGELTFTYAQGMSADGSVVAFSTRANNMIPDDTNGKFDVYVERMW